MSKRHGWSKWQVKSFVREVRKAAGGAWSEYMTSRVQQALIAEHAFYIVRSSHRDSIPTSEANALLEDMLAEAGLEDMLIEAALRDSESVS